MQLLKSSRGMQRQLGDWSISLLRKGWKSWECSAWRRLRGNLMSAYKCLKDRCQVYGARFFLAVPSGGARGTGHKVEYGKFHLNMRRNFSRVRVTRALEKTA